MEETVDGPSAEAGRCLEHGKRLLYFCKVEKLRVCSKCVIVGSHRGHPVASVEEALSELKELLSACAKELESKSLEHSLRLEEINRNVITTKVLNISSDGTCFSCGPVNEPIVRFKGEKFHGPLQYKVWKKMFQVIQTVAEPFTFDPLTAHPHLQVSINHRSVTPRHEALPVGYADCRFDTCLCVLGSEPLSSGKHYWEVNVRNKSKWDLGVANISIPRHGDLIYKPNRGIWCLMLRDGCHYEACDDSDIELEIQRKPGRIGIYVDYEGGEILFLDAETMQTLYVFRASFTEQLLPLYSPCIEEKGTPGDQQLTIFKLNL
ncbi:zinc-binding protein A33-like isoform X2 [Narcine bancroftii]|uniref:zinc-binding protein A33-like isoform X2 n=1 Tax=Narcine bancroftii TaxID=1343680 RepID=UPI003831013E